MAADNELDKDHPFHNEGGQTIFDGPAEREERRTRAREKEDYEFKISQLAISHKQTSIASRTLMTQIALVIFGLLGIGVGIYQAITSRVAAAAAESAAQTAVKTLTETQLYNKRQAALAEQARADAKIANDASTKASNEALHVTIDNFHREQRAWLEVIPEFSKPLPPVDGLNFPPLFDFRFSIKNTGRTAARIIKVADNNRGVLNGKDTKRGIEYAQKSQLLSRSAPAILVPGSDFPWVLRGIMERNSAVSSGGLLLHQYIGRIDYEDVFGTPHWLTFCYQLHDDATPALCEFGNDQDHQIENH